MVIYETEYGNFGTPKDLLKYMEEEGIQTIHVTARICGEIVGQREFEMTIRDVERWVETGKEGIR